ncbi:hypothetical protein BDV96DRAFT_599264 [Lophiotrema nucula]|uniref:Chitin-binding type-1 domain-containing protein n=1 Tax=Lophiotrema nucula TaxID=690887 RepID=A0A6A5Z8D6_9PLEO|nr:hypothetical protein BDV96DRAFT_599264 [Lophiotrema nucula]
MDREIQAAPTLTTVPISATPAPTPTPGSISPDGSCGSKSGYICLGSAFGNCCSSSGFCGSSGAHCTAGCQASFGNCTAADLSPDGTCSGANKYKCKGSTFGDCCSSSGYCGSDSAHCGSGCQSVFGTCTDSSLSPDGTCGGSKGYKCLGSGFGDCCSASGYCGSTSAHCTSGCQSAFGTCGDTSLSPDGTCGGSKGYKCKGTSFGDCCSSSGYCGSGDAFCGVGCQSPFGNCAALTTSAATPKPSGLSPDGSCGGSKGYKCGGSGFGDCCSSGGYCGNTVNHCAQGCQKSFSTACLTSNVPTLNGDCGSSKSGYTCADGPFDGQCCSSDGFCGTSATHCTTGWAELSSFTTLGTQHHTSSLAYDGRQELYQTTVKNTLFLFLSSISRLNLETKLLGNLRLSGGGSYTTERLCREVILGFPSHD